MAYAKKIERYGIYWVDLNPPGKGHEQRKRRPCVVVSPEAMHKAQMAVVCPLTSTIRNWPFHIKVTVKGKPSDIMVEQIRAVSLERFDTLIALLDVDTIQSLRDIIFRMYAV